MPIVVATSACGGHSEGVNHDVHAAARQHYVQAVHAAAAADLGSELAAGTNVVAAADREGSTAAVLYPLGASTVVWCAPELRPRLATLDGQPALDVEGFMRVTGDLGATPVGTGHHRVLTTQLSAPTIGPERIAELHRSNPTDVERIAEFVDACSDDDLDEAELDLDELDPAIFAVLDEAGAIDAYSSARPWSIGGAFDDIAVITRPGRRGQGLGATAVRALIAARQPLGRLMFYNCHAENLGSNRLAESLGFELVMTVAAASFD